MQASTGSTFSRLHDLGRVIDLWHLASLDAPTVAVVWALAFAWAAGVHLEVWIPLLLACGTWTVYIGDRLLDARRAIRAHECDDLRERHYFHWRHRARLLPLALCAAAIAAYLVLRLMPLAVRERDSVIAAAALAYFSGVHSPGRVPKWLAPFVSKEFIVGALFTAGCAAPVMARLHPTVATIAEWPVMVSVAFFALLAWLNCIAIDAWESSEERVLEERAIGFFAAMLCAIGVTAGAALLPTKRIASELLCTGALSAFLLYQLDRMRLGMTPLRVRALADLVLITPAVLLIFPVHRG